MRLLIVSNRLPYTVTEQDGSFTFHASVGGLVSGISSYLDSLRGTTFTSAEYVWIGWPGLSVTPAQQPALQAELAERFHACPVFLEAPVMDAFYHGFCNKTLWPLFHYFPSYAVYDQAAWETYQQVNAAFCEVVLRLAQSGDVVWVHDYHLLLLPQMLRQERPDLSIGFFLHIPFPTYEVFRLLPSLWRNSLVEGILGADLVGVHTPDDAAYFLECAARMLGLNVQGTTLEIADRQVQVGAFPISIDVERFATAAKQPTVQAEIKHLEDQFAGHTMIVSVDRLDYSKGIVQRLEGYEQFLEQHPEWHGRVTLLLVVVPSRIGVERYQEMREQIDAAVGRIHGRFSTLHWTAVMYQFRYMPFATLIALYSVSAVALVTPLRDGMNLVAKEYVASRTDQTGVLILSELAGAAQELREALIINPNDRNAIADAITMALTMPLAEQQRRNRIMQAHLQRADVVQWASTFLTTLRLSTALQTQSVGDDAAPTRSTHGQARKKQ